MVNNAIVSAVSGKVTQDTVDTRPNLSAPVFPSGALSTAEAKRTDKMPLRPPGSDHYCFIIHDNLPYCYDINFVLALPSGSRYRNRFRKSWVEGNLHDNIATMIGANVLIILRVQEQNILIPVRWGTIKEAQQFGGIYYFEYVLGDLIAYSAEPAQRSTEISYSTKLFSDMHVWLPGTAGQMLTEPSVFRSTAGSHLQLRPGDDFTAWGNGVEAVITAPIYDKAEFLKVLGLFDLRGRASPVIDEHYVIRSNTVYQLRVFQYVPAPPGTSTTAPHDIEVVTFTDHFVQLRPKQRAVGLYDELIFVLKSKRLPPKERSAIEIPYNPAPAGTGSYAPRALYLPIITTGRSPAIIILSVVLLIASLIGMFAPKVYHANEDEVRSLATVIFVLVVSGWRTTMDSLFPSLPWQVSK